MFDLRLRRSSLSSSSSLSSLCRLRVGGTQGLPPFYCRKEFNGKMSLLNLLRASEFKSRWNNCERNIPLISCRNVSRLVRWTFHKSQQEFPPHPCITENWEIHKNGDRNKKKRKERKERKTNERKYHKSFLSLNFQTTFTCGSRRMASHEFEFLLFLSSPWLVPWLMSPSFNRNCVPASTNVQLARKQKKIIFDCFGFN